MLHSEFLHEYDSLRRGRFLLPDYQRYCLANIPTAVFSLFGRQNGVADPLADLWKKHVEPGRFSKVVMFFLDGFGFLQWQKYAAEFDVLRRFSERGNVYPITSVFPATTVAGVTSMNTGVPPAQHGLVEWWTYFRELDSIVTILPFNRLGSEQRDELRKEGIDPKLLLDRTTVSEQMVAAGIQPYSFLSEKYVDSAYNSVASRGTRFIAYASLEDFVIKLSSTVATTKGPAYYYAYWPGIDDAGHIYGTHSEKYITAIKEFSGVVEREFFHKLSSKIARETLVLLAADHGQVPVDPSTIFSLNEIPGFVDMLAVSTKGKKILPWGLPRDVYLQVQDGHVDDVLALLREHLGDTADVLRSRDALEHHYFGYGMPHPEFASRIGNIMILPRGHNGVWFEHIPGRRAEHRGMHGGMTDEEVLIPFGIVPMTDLIS